ncbi:MAG: hypothetical protein WBB28_20825 [Crinalium sp.]
MNIHQYMEQIVRENPHLNLEGSRRLHFHKIALQEAPKGDAFLWALKPHSSELWKAPQSQGFWWVRNPVKWQKDDQLAAHSRWLKNAEKIFLIEKVGNRVFLISEVTYAEAIALYQDQAVLA